jgi:hypothetical protein
VGDHADARRQKTGGRVSLAGEFTFEKPREGGAMPWLSEEVPGWEDLSDEERERMREAVKALGMDFPDPDDDEYYE